MLGFGWKWNFIQLKMKQSLVSCNFNDFGFMYAGIVRKNTLYTNDIS